MQVERLLPRNSYHILVSVTQAVGETGTANPSGDKGSSARRALHSWVLSVQSHETHVPLHPTRDRGQAHYVATESKGEDEPYTLSSVSPDNIIGTILLAENTTHDPDAIHGDLATEFELGRPIPSKDRGEEPEQWMQFALQALQRHSKLPKFDVDEFLVFARQYAEKRASGDAPKIVAYPPLFNDEHAAPNIRINWVNDPRPVQE